MSLIDLWRNDRQQLTEKQFQQIIAFAGGGKLTDGGEASTELREFLRYVSSDVVSGYISQCLDDSFPDSGLALQDLVNEIGRRLDLSVIHGRYRGSISQPGHDGIWTKSDGHKFIIEVKTTDAYRIDLNRIAGYRQTLADSGIVELTNSSVLVVVGREDTGGLEAQIRGSRHAWDMRVISVDALLKLLRLKEGLEDPSVLKRIHGILVPREFTRLDPIIEIAFAAVEDTREEEVVEGSTDDAIREKQFTPVAFHEQCIARIEQQLNLALVKRSRASFESLDPSVRVVCAVSKFHEKAKRYWFAFHPHQQEFLSQADKAFSAFGCGDASKLFLIPFADFQPWLTTFYQTHLIDRSYWHVVIREVGTTFRMTGKEGTEAVDVTKYLVK